MAAEKPIDERLSAALDIAFDEHVATVFKALIGNLIEANAAGAQISSEQAFAMFKRGIMIGLDAYSKAKTACASAAPASRG